MARTAAARRDHSPLQIYPARLRWTAHATDWSAICAHAKFIRSPTGPTSSAPAAARSRPSLNSTRTPAWRPRMSSRSRPTSSTSLRPRRSSPVGAARCWWTTVRAFGMSRCRPARCVIAAFRRRSITTVTPLASGIAAGASPSRSAPTSGSPTRPTRRPSSACACRMARWKPSRPSATSAPTPATSPSACRATAGT